MAGLLSRTWFPAAVVTLAVVQGAFSNERVDTEWGMMEESPMPDTVLYDVHGYRKGWTEEEKYEVNSVSDSSAGVNVIFDEDQIEKRPVALDTIIPPDSLLQVDTFLYKYYAAVKDSLCHRYVRDSLLAAGDSTDWPVLDSLFAIDSAIVARDAFLRWYASLDPKERKDYDKEQSLLRKRAVSDSLDAVRDSVKTVKDSIVQNTPRILETFVFQDSMLYQRIVGWTHDREFHNVKLRDLQEEVGLNYRFNDYPFLKKDVDATWLGVSGSPVQSYNYFRRDYKEGVFFFDAQESWTYNPANLPMYNTKTPYTELAYWGTLIATGKKESDNLHLMTTQNITPALNFTLDFDRFGGGGILTNEDTKNKTLFANVNYLGRRYLMHAGVISNNVVRSENGGVADNSMIRDTTVDAREIPVNLSSAASNVRKLNVFLDQQYRIPLFFLMSDEQLDRMENDSTFTDEDITTAFIGHSSDFSTYSRSYTDEIQPGEKDFYANYNYNPTVTNDSLRVTRLENKVFARLQPWSRTAFVSNLDVGVGLKLMKYREIDPKFLHLPSYHNWSATYLYAGAGGSLKEYFHWDALGHLTLLGDEAGDFDIAANAGFKFYPFRRAKESPLTIDLHFETNLKEPDYYLQHIYTNHFSWNNEFSKISTTKVGGKISVPRWRLSAEVNYALLANNLYYDTTAFVRQNATPMSIFSAALNKDFVLGPVHLDNRLLFQLSSDNDVVPLPKLALNGRYYVQFKLGRDKVMTMQIGANFLYNTVWNAPSWNPALGVFYNQTKERYGNAIYFDPFVNVQWKRACIFVKLENAGQGWPHEKFDYFSANHYIRTQRMVKIGIFWPFYTQPAKLDKIPGPGDNPNL